MKYITHYFLSFFAVAGLLLGPRSLFASETRVDSVGGLTSVIDDETNNMDLFLDGNPAGLILLKTHDRFDLTGQWTYSDVQPSTVGSTQQTLSTIPRLSNDGKIRYGGLMIFPAPHWAFQVGGDFLYSQGQVAANYLGDTYSTSQYRGVLRAAFDSGPFAFGLEFDDTEPDISYDPGLFNPYVGQSSGSSNENQALVRAGVITTFPENPGKDSPRWEVGGVFEAQVGLDSTNVSDQRFYLNSPAFSFQQVNSATQYYYFGPEIHFEIPGRLLIRFSSFVNDHYTQLTQNVSPSTVGFPSLPAFTLTQYQSMNNVGGFRLTLPLSERENLKLGGSLTAFLNNTDIFGSQGRLNDNQNRQQINGTIGVGLETPGDHTLGLQFISQNYLTDVELVSANSTTATDYDLYQLALGGEKWLSPQWALRGGLIVEEDIYTQSVNLNSLNATVTTGLGFEDKGIKLDGKFLLGQGVSLDNLSHNGISLGAEIQGTIFL